MKERTQDRIAISILCIFCLGLLAAVPGTITALTTYDSVADMAAYHNPALLKSAHVRGYYAPGDGGGGHYAVTNSVTSTNLGGRIKALLGGGTYSFDAIGPDVSNVRRWGAKGNGSFDDTASILSRYNSLNSTNGGVIDASDGNFKFNLTIAKGNVTLRGNSHSLGHSFGATLTNCWAPADTSLPVVTIGNDSGYVRGVIVENATFEGSAGGNVGFKFGGGAEECILRDCAIAYFKTNLLIQAGATYPASSLRIERVDGVANATADNVRGVQFIQASTYPASYVTHVRFEGGHWYGPGLTGTNSFWMGNDSCEIDMDNFYTDAYHGHGIILTNTILSPILNISDSRLDSGNATNIVIQGYDNARNFAGIITKNFQVSGQWREADGTLRAIPRTILRRDSAVRGIFHILNNGAADGNTYLYFEDAINGKTNFIRMLNGLLSLTPPTGGASRMTDSSGNPKLQVNATGALFVQALAASSTGLYTDSNQQLQASPSATATLDFASTGAGNSSELTITATGAAVGDPVVLGTPAAPNANTCFTARVSAADTVTVRFNNYSSGAVDPASGSFKVTVLK